MKELSSVGKSSRRAMRAASSYTHLPQMQETFSDFLHPSPCQFLQQCQRSPALQNQLLWRQCYDPSHSTCQPARDKGNRRQQESIPQLGSNSITNPKSSFTVLCLCTWVLFVLALGWSICLRHALLRRWQFHVRSGECNMFMIVFKSNLNPSLLRPDSQNQNLPLEIFLCKTRI